MPDVYIVGAGPQGRIVLDILRAQRPSWSIEFLDDAPAVQGQSICGIGITGTLDSILGSGSKPAVGVIVAVGKPSLRLTIMRRVQEAGITLTNAVHPSAVIMSSVRLGRGVIVHPGAVINTNADVRDGVIVNTNATVEHDTLIEEGACISPGAQTGGRVVIGAGAFLGSGCIVLKRLVVGAGAIVAAGSIVTRDVSPQTLVMGSPAKIKERIGRDFDWGRVL